VISGESVRWGVCLGGWYFLSLDAMRRDLCCLRCLIIASRVVCLSLLVCVSRGWVSDLVLGIVGWEEMRRECGRMCWLDRCYGSSLGE